MEYVKLTAVQMYCVCTLKLLDGGISALRSNVEKWDTKDRPRGRAFVTTVEGLRDACFSYLPLDKGGNLRLCPFDSHWYVRSNKRMVKALRSTLNHEHDARAMINALLWLAEDARYYIPRLSSNVDERVSWGDLCEALALVLQEYDPDFTHQEFIDSGSRTGELVKASILKH